MQWKPYRSRNHEHCVLWSGMHMHTEVKVFWMFYILLTHNWFHFELFHNLWYILMQLLFICWPLCFHFCLLLVGIHVYVHISVTESPSLPKMLFRNDTFRYDSVALSRTAYQGSGIGMRCQAATSVCCLVSTPYCHFVTSHYPNEKGSRKAVTEHGYG